MSDNAKLNEIAHQAERDLNTYQAKTGRGQTTGLEDAGVNELSADKFPGSQVKYGDDLVTNAGYNRRIPGDEGGDVDERGRMVGGSAYEGVGGPEDKVAKRYEQHSGQMDESDVKGWGKDPRQLERPPEGTRGEAMIPQNEVRGHDRGGDVPRSGDVMERGRKAAQSNVGTEGVPPYQGARGGSFKGEDYYTPEEVPDSTADQNEVPPESATAASRYT